VNLNKVKSEVCIKLVLLITELTCLWISERIVLLPALVSSAGFIKIEALKIDVITSMYYEIKQRSLKEENQKYGRGNENEKATDVFVTVPRHQTEVTPHIRNIDTTLKCAVSYQHGSTLLPGTDFRLPSRHEVEWLTLTLHSTEKHCQALPATCRFEALYFISLNAQKVEGYIQIRINFIDVFNEGYPIM
jgi:hypothetical protein